VDKWHCVEVQGCTKYINQHYLHISRETEDKKATHSVDSLFSFSKNIKKIVAKLMEKLGFGLSEEEVLEMIR